jgi:GNAT superfamily N-acetyltransferase
MDGRTSMMKHVPESTNVPAAPPSSRSELFGDRAGNAVCYEATPEGLFRVVRAAEALLQARGCPKVNLQILAANRDVVRFYERLGFAVEERVSMGKRLATPRAP